VNDKTQRGTAIFMALLVIAITASITVTMLRFQRLDIMRTQLMIHSEQAYLYAQGVIAWAAVALKQEIAKSSTDNTTWPMLLPPTLLPDGRGKISGVLEQAQARFNINNFSTQINTDKNESANLTARETLIKLIRILDPEQSRDKVQDLLNAIQSWTSTTSNPEQTPQNQQQPMPMDYYDNQYSLLKPAYRSPHQPMASISELRVVSGMNAKLYQKLQPYLTALPVKTTIDTRYASPLLLQAMGLSDSKVNPKGDAVKNDHSFFLLRVDVYANEQHFVLYTMLKRDTAAPGKQSTITQLWQSFGTV
jgi:general secretion pathway protein K